MNIITRLQALFANWQGDLEGAENLLEQSQPLFQELQKTSITPNDQAALQALIVEYRKLVTFLQQEKLKVQRETSKLNKMNLKVRDYVQYNQSSGYEFYY
ncbi:hypothetical protein [Enterococcus lemanii]|uniref:Flagellar protein FliT n=1 Tax=Enterococcus lemanii TaxID=1159752 RepID=A0ABV9MXU3_9ENTE|nr:hypothetical protein [Enterococcus lemanii]MBM7708096.1 hypothetical protein [Enterococcus lemanii]